MRSRHDHSGPRAGHQPVPRLAGRAHRRLRTETGLPAHRIDDRQYERRVPVPQPPPARRGGVPPGFRRASGRPPAAVQTHRPGHRRRARRWPGRGRRHSSHPVQPGRTGRRRGLQPTETLEHSERPGIHPPHQTAPGRGRMGIDLAFQGRRRGRSLPDSRSQRHRARGARRAVRLRFRLIPFFTNSIELECRLQAATRSQVREVRDGVSAQASNPAEAGARSTAVLIVVP